MTDTLLNTEYEQNPSNRSGASEEHRHTDAIQETFRFVRSEG
jgi:hypothetical protein